MRLLCLLLLSACAATPPATPTSPTVPTSGVEVSSASPQHAAAVVTFRPVHHATLEISTPAGIVWLDPTIRSPLGAPHNADVVLITDVHADHFDAAGIDAVIKPGARVIVPPAIDADISGATDTMANGDVLSIGGLHITAVPMYNNHRGPEDGQLFHPKGRGNGYLIEVADERIYVAGDTACTDDMKTLTGITTAFIPMNLPYTMTPEEAAECVAAFQPTQVIPYHYRGAGNVMSDRSAFTEALAATDITVTLLDFYPSL